MMSLREAVKRFLPRRVVGWLQRLLDPAAPVSNRLTERRWRFPEFGPGADRMDELEAELWATGDARHAQKLESMVKLTSATSSARSRGLLALARWDFHRGEVNSALTRLEGVQPHDADLRKELDLFRVDCLCYLGEGRRALSVLSRMTGRHTIDRNLLLRVGHARSLLGEAANHGSGPVAESLNRIYRDAGVGMIRRTSVVDPVGLDNISCDVPGAEPAESLPVVTVVVLIPDSPPEGHSGITSLLDQSWRNVEILVVGQRGLQEHLADVDETLLGDGRVVSIEGNGDTHEALVAGVSSATGELVTFHLYGSWAHPQRLEVQATALLADPSLRATVSSHMNVRSDINPSPLGITPRVDLVGPSPYSTMIRTSGMAPDDVSAAYGQVVESYSPVTGDLEPSEDVAFVKDGVPLTLTLANHRSLPLTVSS